MNNLKKNLSLSILLLMLANATIAFGQNSVSPRQTANSQQRVLVDEAFLIEAEKAIADRQRLQAVTTAQAEALAAKDQQIAALRGLLQVQTLISQDWKEAATARASALKTDTAMIAQFEKNEARLRAERDSARRAGRWLGAGGLVLGIVVGAFVARGN